MFEYGFCEREVRTAENLEQDSLVSQRYFFVFEPKKANLASFSLFNSNKRVIVRCLVFRKQRPFRTPCCAPAFAGRSLRDDPPVSESIKFEWLRFSLKRVPTFSRPSACTKHLFNAAKQRRSQMFAGACVLRWI